MSNLPAIRAEEALGSVLQEIEAAFYDIPFENSTFQTEAFVIAAQQTPARAYRAIGLRMMTKIQAVRAHEIKKARNQIDLDEKEAKLADSEISEFDKRRLRLDIMELQADSAYGDKLLNDALRELDVLYAWFKRLPRYTREQFEAEEFTHFSARMERQLKCPGPLESIENMKADLPSMPTRIQGAFAQIAHNEAQKLEEKG